MTQKHRDEVFQSVIEKVCNMCTASDECTHDVYDNPNCVKFCWALEDESAKYMMTQRWEITTGVVVTACATCEREDCPANRVGNHINDGVLFVLVDCSGFETSNPDLQRTHPWDVPDGETPVVPAPCPDDEAIPF